jgi:hypothetical protein
VVENNNFVLNKKSLIKDNNNSMYLLGSFGEFADFIFLLFDEYDIY